MKVDEAGCQSGERRKSYFCEVSHLRLRARAQQLQSTSGAGGATGPRRQCPPRLSAMDTFVDMYHTLRDMRKRQASAAHLRRVPTSAASRA